MENIYNPDQFSIEREIIDTSKDFIWQLKIRENIVKAGILINCAEFERAIIVLNEVLMEDEENIDALNDITVAYILNGNYSYASNTINKVLAANPGNEIAQDNLAYLKSRISD